MCAYTSYKKVIIIIIIEKYTFSVNTIHIIIILCNTDEIKNVY